MASEERKAADSKIREDNLFASLGAGEQQAETDAFQCGRCKQRKCRYRQAQTRSADEPMTVSFMFFYPGTRHSPRLTDIRYVSILLPIPCM